MVEFKVSALHTPEHPAWVAVDNHVDGVRASFGMNGSENLVIPTNTYNRYYARALENGDSPEAAHGVALVAVVIVGELCQEAYRTNRGGRG